MVPASARALFPADWLAALLFQPINAFAFATDGIHWGSGDFRYLRNAMLGASALGVLAVLMLDTAHPQALVRLWVITGGWITLRALFGTTLRPSTEAPRLRIPSSRWSRSPRILTRYSRTTPKRGWPT